MKNYILFTILIGVFSIQLFFAQPPAKDTPGPVKMPAPKKGPPLPAPDQGITSPTHQKYVKKIVFTKVDQPMAQINEAGFTNEFKLGDLLYYRVFLEKSSVNQLRAGPGGDQLNGVVYVRPVYKMTFYLDGRKLPEKPMIYSMKPDEHAKWTTWRGAFKMDDSLRRPDLFLPGESEFIEFLSDMESTISPGKHSIKVEIRPVISQPDMKIEGDVMAAGEFTLNVPAGWVNRADTWLCLPKAAMKDAPLERKMMAAFAAARPKESGRTISITLPAWAIVRNNLTGIILHRTTSAAVGSETGGVCRMQIYDFSQEYVGNAFAGDPYLSFAGIVQRRMPCGCLK
jgi:hypothetical protein